MITKLGKEFIKAADLIGAGVGAYRASNLSEEDRKLLKDEYGLSDDASLGWRNAGRGFLGGTAGGMLGGGITLPIAMRLANRHPVAAQALAAAGSLGGYLAGSGLATNKYSKGRADEIRKQRAMTKESALGAGIGMLRAGELTPEDKQLLCEEYGLPGDANMVARNAGRGYLGGLGGGLVGSALGVGVGKLLARKNPALGYGAAIAGSLAGAGIGMGLATNKYSRRHADEIRKRKSLEAELQK